MKQIKGIIVILSLAFSLGFIPTTAIAAGPLSAASAKASIKTVIGHTKEAIKAIDSGENNKSIKTHIKAALRESKEITGTELLEKKRLKVSRSLKKARSALKKDNKEETKAFLIKTVEDFEKLKSYI